MRTKYIAVLMVIFFCSQIAAANAAGQRGLLLEECLKLAVTNSFEARVARLDFLISQTDQSAAEAIFDTNLSIDLEYTKDKQQQLSIVSSPGIATNTYSADVSKKLPTGTELNVSFSDTRTESNSIYVSDNPAHTAEIEAELRQSLARNAFGYVDRRNVSVTSLSIQNADLDNKERIESLLAEVETAYWDWAFYKRSLEIYRGILEKAKYLHKTNVKNYDTGLIERGDFLASRANILIREKDVLLAENQYRRAEEKIKLLMSVDTTNRIYPEETLEYTKREIELENCLRKAFQKRRDYLQAKRNVEIKNIVLETRENERWPEIDLVASMAANGISRKFGKAAAKIGSDNNAKYFAGLEFSLPIENNLARSEFEKAAHNKEKAIITLKAVERLIITEIGDGFRDYLTYQTNLSKLGEAAALQQEKLKEEEKRFKYGRSSTKRLIDYQQDCLSAELQLVAGVLDCKKAEVNLNRTLNVILEKYRGIL
ncbi:MAG: TolC family protein [Candidatus Omnitrophota bacterium]|nr:TolC family protein [Candidatus Omnitrophota bacterium]